MANRNLNARQQQKHDTSSNFNSKNATYLEAEILIESDTGRVKIADGDTDYKTLPYTIGTRVPTDAKFTDTTYTASGGLSLSGTTFSIANSGVTADTYGPTANVSGSWGTSFTVPSVVVNTKGQVTSAVDRTVTMPAKPTAADIGAEPAFTKNTAFNKNFGTASGTVCEGDDERLSDARPASDVSAWAKAATKPTYTPTEVGVIGTAPTSGQVAVFDGTTGKIKSTGFTIATSVPAGAKFTDTTYSNYVGATTSASGTAGLVPSAAAGAATRYLRSDGTWQVPPDTNTTYANFVGASSGTAGSAGLVPAPSASANTRFLGSTGMWTFPPSATTVKPGYMSAADKTKLDGIADNANNYYLPLAASSVRGGVRIGYATSGKNYAVQLSNEQMYVNVPWENTTYTNGDGLSLSDGTFSIEDTGVTADLYGPGGDSSPLFGGTFMVPYFAVNSKGQILTATNRRIKIPSNTFVGASTASGGTSGLVPAPNAGQSTRYLCSNGEWSIPAGTVYNGSTTISVKPSTTDGEYNIYLVALFPGTTSQSVGPNAAGTINFGSAFNVPYITIDQYGRIKALTNRSMILSGALASSSAPGLCPKLDSSHPSYYLNANGSWTLPRGRVYGVKGEAETDYREGQVNITASNIGALALTGGTVTGATTFSSDVTISGELNYDGGFY